MLLCGVGIITELERKKGPVVSKLNQGSIFLRGQRMVINVIYFITVFKTNNISVILSTLEEGCKICFQSSFPILPHRTTRYLNLLIPHKMFKWTM